MWTTTTTKTYHTPLKHIQSHLRLLPKPHDEPAGQPQRLMSLSPHKINNLSVSFLFCIVCFLPARACNKCWVSFQQAEDSVCKTSDNVASQKFTLKGGWYLLLYSSFLPPPRTGYDQPHASYRERHRNTFCLTKKRFHSRRTLSI